MKEINILQKTSELAMYLTLAYVNKGDTVLDATCGNGHDTLSLAKACGNSGKVIAMDIQNKAIYNTKRRLEEKGILNTFFIQDNFINMDQYAEEGSLSAIVFNLGYMPGEDKRITTIAQDTIKAIEKALFLIKVGGVITITMYPGHSEGRSEKNAILKMAATLSPSIYHCVYMDMHNQSQTAPCILAITKKK